MLATGYIQCEPKHHHLPPSMQETVFMWVGGDIAEVSVELWPWFVSQWDEGCFWPWEMQVISNVDAGGSAEGCRRVVIRRLDREGAD